MFNEDKDRVISEIKNEKTGLWFSLSSYNGGAPKVQIGPREIGKKNGSPVYAKAGRVTPEEFEWMAEIYRTQFSKLVILPVPQDNPSKGN